MGQFVIPEDPDNEFDSDADWAEWIDQLKPGGPAALSNEGQEDVLVGDVPPNKLRAAARRVLGYSVADDGSPYRLRRVLPWRHPRFDYLFASGFTAEFYNPAGNPDNDENKPYIPAVTDTDPPQKTANYTRARCSVKFGRAPGRVMDDEDQEFIDLGEEEWLRFTQLDAFEPQLELQVVEGTDGSSMYFAETSAGPPPGPNVGPPSTNPNATPFQAGFYVRKTTSRQTVAWKGVDELYICEEGDGPLLRPTRLLNALGTVNAETLWGRKPGTMLLDGIKLRRYQAPVSVFGGGAALWQHDVYLTWLEFDPKRGAPDQTPATNNRYGHLLQPYRGDRRWYYATSGDRTTAGTLGGRPALESTDHRELFRHVADPAYTSTLTPP
jgi:hypothetical protein